jgi:hypothetical protein
MQYLRSLVLCWESRGDLKKRDEREGKEGRKQKRKR